MDLKTWISAGMLVIGLSFASYAPPAAAVEPTPCAGPADLCTLSLVVDGETGAWDLEVDERLVCDTSSISGTSPAGEAVAFTIGCETPLPLRWKGDICEMVAVEAETWNGGYVEALAKCGSLEAYCQAEAGMSHAAYCWDEEHGSSSPPPLECSLYVSGSGGWARCYFGLKEPI